MTKTTTKVETPTPKPSPKGILRKKVAKLYQLFAICPGGLEDVLRKELLQLNAPIKDSYPGGIEFEGDLEMAYTANLSLRTASRVLLLLHESQDVHQGDEFYRAMQEVQWYTVFSPNCTFAIYVTETHSRPRSHPLNPQFLALKAKDSLVDQFRERFETRPSVDRKDPDITIRLHLHDDTLKIYLDLSGRSLHERGYRNEALEAPLKENLAAGLLYLSAWDERCKEEDIVFYDPFCGSGTILIEAAMIATKTAPGLTRTSFGFFAWRDHVPSVFEKVQEKLKEQIIRDPALVPMIIGSDIDGRAVSIAQRNIENAGLSDMIKLNVGAFESTEPLSPKGLIVTNPPYGVRLDEEKNLLLTYAAMGSTFKHRYKNWEAGVISSEKKLLQEISLKPSKKIPLHNGGLDSFFYFYKFY